MKITQWYRLGLGARLSLAVLSVVGIVLIVFALTVSRENEHRIESASVQSMRRETELLVKMFSSTDRDFRQRTESLSRAFVAQFAGTLELHADQRLDINGRATPVLTHNGKPLNLNFALLDPFSASSGAVATIFARDGEDFVRITTSLKNDAGERAVGTLLDRQHPGYKTVASGGTYIGLATLFGRQYMTRYEPLQNENGAVIGLAFVGLDLTQSLATLKKTVSDMRIGKTGYYFVMDAKPGKTQGQALVHPVHAGENLLGNVDADGRTFYKEMIERQSGTLAYRLQNVQLGEDSAREKVAVFATVPAWQWVIAGGTYIDELSEEVRADRNRSLAIALALTLLCVPLLFLLIRRMVTVPLGQIRDAARAMADGDLTVRLRSRRGDEIGALSQAMDSVGRSLTEVVSVVRDNAQSVAVASAQIAQGNQDLASRTASQASVLQQTASASHELTLSVQNNLAVTDQVGMLASVARDNAELGRQAVSKVAGTMESIEVTSQRVADISGLIDGIAFQTNILALNAAVEAARAGEQGRGFAVVAAEVRALAQRSADAAKEIKGLIEQSVRRVLDGSNEARQAGNTMQEMVESISHVSLSMHKIVESSMHQTSGVQDLSSAMVQVDESTQQNSALVEEMAAATNCLREQARQLVASVAVFKLQ